MPFCSVELADRVEHTEAQMSTTATDTARNHLNDARLVIPIAGGAAHYAENDSPMKRSSASRGRHKSRTRQSCEYPHRCGLDESGYQLVAFENVLRRSLDRDLQPVGPTGVEVRLADDRRRLADLVVDGFAHPDAEVSPRTGNVPHEVIDNVLADSDKQVSQRISHPATESVVTTPAGVEIAIKHQRRGSTCSTPRGICEAARPDPYRSFHDGVAWMYAASPQGFESDVMAPRATRSGRVVWREIGRRP